MFLFRITDYKYLGIMKRQFPDVPILGLTATATTSVLQDVRKILNIENCQLFRASFNRPNLFYEVCVAAVTGGSIELKSQHSETTQLLRPHCKNQLDMGTF